MNKYIKSLIITSMVVLVIIAGSLVYYYVFFKPNNEKAKWQAQLKVEEEEWKAKLKLEEEKLNLDKEKRLEETREEQNKKILLSEALTELDKWYNSALVQAYNNYSENWDRECENLGLRPGSALPTDVADRVEKQYDQKVEWLDKQYQSKKDEIFKLYE